MQKFLSELFSSDRLKSFLWRGGAVVVVAGLNYLSANIGEFNLSPQMVIFVALIVGEITKAVNNAVKSR